MAKDKKTWVPRLNVLISYAFLRSSKTYRTVMEAMLPYTNILIDSGAFTNWSEAIKSNVLGQESDLITMDEYCEFIDHYEKDIWQYIALDVIRDPEGTQRNLDEMYQRGYKPMPVLTPNEDVKVVKSYVDNYSRRICISGGAGGKKEAALRKRFRDAFDISGGKALIHGLGYMRWPDTFFIPIATSDASSSSSGARFGVTQVYTRDKGYLRFRLDDVNKYKSMKQAEKDVVDLVLSKLRSYNIPSDMIFDNKYYRTMHGINTLVTLFSVLEHQAHCDEVGYGLFDALSASTWGLLKICSLAAVDKDKPGIFDYMKAVEIHKEVTALIKEKPQAAGYLLENYIKDSTNWETNHLLTQEYKVNKRNRIVSWN